MKQRILTTVVLFAPLAWLFGAALVRDEMFVYRDAAHYYYPLYSLVADRWGDGNVPLWNARENLGQPLLADATAAVVYPGKLVFASPLGFDANYKLYIVGHVLLAAVTALAAARSFGRSLYGATLAALAYAYGGSVLFQYCNVVYLVGAAWLPLAVLAIDRTLRERSWRWAIALGAVLALMTLGGDPQCAYHTGLAAVLYAFILWRSERSSANVERPRRWLLLGVAALSLFVLAAVQLLPAAEWTRHSTRAAWDQPRNIYEAAASLRVSDASRVDRYSFLLGRTTAGQHEETYDFSVGPWQLASLVWPNIFGQVFPTNTRWINALPAEGRTWTPSLYIGLLPLVLALTQLRFFSRADERIRWLSWLALLALVASFGWYGLGWVAREIYFAAAGPDAAETSWGAPFGGLYWLLNSLLPGYAYFRYPAKWLVFAQLALCLLAAYGWDHFSEHHRQVRRIVVIVATASALLAFLFAVFSAYFLHAVSDPAAGTGDALFGPLDLDRTRRVIAFAIGHALGAAIILLAYVAWHGAKSQTPTLSAWLLLFIVVDLAFAQAVLISTAPAKNWRNTPAVASAIERDRNADSDAFMAPVRVRRFALPLPKDWATTSSPDRQQIGQAWDHATLLPKYALLTDLEMVSSSSALRSVDVVEFLRAQRRRSNQMVFEQYRIAPAGRRIAGEQVPVDGVEATQLVRVAASPRAWIVHDVTTLAPLVDRHADAVWRRSNEVLDLASNRGFDELAVVEADQPLPKFGAVQLRSTDDEYCRITHYSDERVEIDVSLKAAGLVVLADAFDSSWQCRVHNLRTRQFHDAAVLRTNRILRGVVLEPGEYRLEFRYRPTSVYLGAGLSALGWLALAVVVSQRLAQSFLSLRRPKGGDELRPGH